ncbi:MAG: ABC transporter permease [Bacteroidota bacterium]
MPQHQPSPPPRWLLGLFRWFCHPDFAEDIEGDLRERYARQAEHAGRTRANLRLTKEVLLLCRPGIVRPFYRPQPKFFFMFNNYLKSAWRNLWKRKKFSLINLLGLSIGMAACLLILQYIQYEQSYDDFHQDLSRLYRLNLGMTDQGGSEIAVRATNHPAVGAAIKQDFPQVEDFARMVDVKIFFGSAIVSYKEDGEAVQTYYEDELYIADSSVLRMFSFPMLKGDPKTALREKFSIVITESMAERYFGAEDPMGKFLYLNGNFEVKVTGVLKDLPHNTHLNIRALLSSSLFGSGVNDAWIWPEFYTYLKLAPGTQPEDLTVQLDGFVEKYLGEVMQEFGIREEMYLQPVADIHLEGNLMKEVKENGNQATISFLMLIAGMILLIAWMNYINLSTSRSLERASEVGIRKVVGARRGNLIFQFLMEAGLMNTLAIFLAVALTLLLTPAFNQLVGRPVIGGIWLSPLWQEPMTWALLAMMLIGGTFLAGLYPAFVLSSFRPVRTIKGKMFRSGKKVHFRHVMVVFQFAISLLMIAGTLLVYRQLSFMQNQHTGFEMDQMLVTPAPSIGDSTIMDRAENFRNEMESLAQVDQLTLTSDIPGHIIQNVNSIKLKGQSTDEAVFATMIFTDEHYLSTYDIELVAGRNFSKEFSTDDEAVMLNEKAVEMLGYAQPEDILGEVISRKMYSWQDRRVVGVVKNVNHRSFAHKQVPFAYFNRYLGPEYFTLRVQPQQMEQTLAAVEKSYISHFPGNPFDYFFLDDYFSRQYKADQQFGKVFSIFAGLAIFIACLGLLGLISYITSSRTKEIGIRKILGASAPQIIYLLGRPFIALVFIAAVIAIPLAWLSGEQWLQQYAYQAPLSMWVFLVPLLMVLLLAGLTIFWETSRIARSNPAESLRYE